MKLIDNCFCFILLSVFALFLSGCEAFRHISPRNGIIRSQTLARKTFTKYRMTLQAVVHSNQKEFDQVVLQSDIPVLVDFYANWCGPCKMMSPVLDQVAQEWEGKLKIVKIDADENEDLVESYQVQGLPTFTLFHNGKVVGSFAGAVPKERLKQFITTELTKRSIDFL